LAARELSRLAGAHALLSVAVGALIEMKPHLLFEVAVQTPAMEKRPATQAEVR
jgi:hypothetical protein